MSIFGQFWTLFVVLVRSIMKTHKNASSAVFVPQNGTTDSVLFNKFWAMVERFSQVKKQEEWFLSGLWSLHSFSLDEHFEHSSQKSYVVRFINGKIDNENGMKFLEIKIVLYPLIRTYRFSASWYTAFTDGVQYGYGGDNFLSVTDIPKVELEAFVIAVSTRITKH